MQGEATDTNIIFFGLSTLNNQYTTEAVQLTCIHDRNSNS
jgi:hypothetical protein